MIFQTNNLIPEVYGRERDVQVITSLLDIVTTIFKHYIDDLGCIYEPNDCPEQFLPLLADTLNYKYNFLDTVTVNRKIIDVFSVMEQHRGSEIGLKMASALCLTARDISVDNNEIDDATDYVNALKDLKVTYCYEPEDNEYGYKATILIDYPNTYTLVRYLLDYVRPVGMYIQLRSIENLIHSDEMVILAQLKAQALKYDIKIRSGVNSGVVNFSSPVNEKQISDDGILIPDKSMEHVISYLDSEDFQAWQEEYPDSTGLFEVTDDAEETKENWLKFLQDYNNDWIFNSDDENIDFDDAIYLITMDGKYLTTADDVYLTVGGTHPNIRVVDIDDWYDTQIEDNVRYIIIDD